MSQVTLSGTIKYLFPLLYYSNKRFSLQFHWSLHISGVAQGFGVVTSDPFSSGELVESGYESRVYQATSHLFINLMVILTSPIIVCLAVNLMVILTSSIIVV